MANEAAQELVTLTIDGKTVKAPKGTNLIEVAKAAGIDIPHYCYHKHLSIAGNCRMCQIRVKGAPKLDIACNTVVKEGMEVATHLSSKEVADAQAAVLEFLLINHPLDCTICDQAGHCKLQDYHFEYNARPSRFLEEKEHKVKAVPMGPTVMLDGERCIMCTRCIRFCDEVTKTSELGMLNRGDRSVIAINPGRELNNPLSGTVVDLCPVGALTHRQWRFNTRIWFTAQNESICPGCSTGCNTKVATRDNQVVQVKARMNSEVNKEWMCDEGRYGFHRFLPEKRLLKPRVGGHEVSWEQASKAARDGLNKELLVFVSPDLLYEEYWLLKQFLTKHAPIHTVVTNYRERPLTDVEKLLISPDYASNFRGAEFAGLVYGNLEEGYLEALERVRRGEIRNVLLVGDRAIGAGELDQTLGAALAQIPSSVMTASDAAGKLLELVKVALPGRSILEKSGLMINRRMRLQYTNRILPPPVGSEAEWVLLNRIAADGAGALTRAQGERELTLECLATEPRLRGLRISDIKQGGVDLTSYQPRDAAAAA